MTGPLGEPYLRSAGRPSGAPIEPSHSFDPYAPPKADGDSVDHALLLDGDLASRWQRLGASMVDGLVGAAAYAPGYLGTTRAAVAQKGVKFKDPFFIYTHAGRWGVIAAVLSLGVLAVEWYLIATRGQSLGKMVAKTRIVKLDGSRASFGQVIGLRTWSVWVVGHLAVAIQAIGFLMLVDILMVFRKDRRCLHDLLAGTKVIAVRK